MSSVTRIIIAIGVAAMLAMVLYSDYQRTARAAEAEASLPGKLAAARAEGFAEGAKLRCAKPAKTARKAK